MRFTLLFTCFLSCSVLAQTQQPSINLQNLALQKSYLQTIDCKAPKRITTMLNEALKETDNYAAKANLATILEEIMVKNPPCFIQAVNSLPLQACLQVKENFIDETFFYPCEEIKNALASAKNFSKSCIAS